MIEIIKNNGDELQVLQEVVGGSWINVLDPTADEVQLLTALGIPQDFITYPLDIDERSRIEREDSGETLMIIRIPYFQGVKMDVPFTTIPLGVVLTDNLILTICQHDNEVIQEFRSGRRRKLSTGKRNRFLLRIMLVTAQKYLVYLRQINKTTEQLEDRLQVSMRNKDMLELLKYQKSLVYFATGLKSNGLAFERLQRGQLFQMYPDDLDLLEDVITENQQAIEMTTISTNILISMMDTFGSIISNNLNSVMKFLASVTIVLSLPTLITSYFGMNVRFPLQDNGLAYIVILGVCVVLSMIVIGLFVKRDWF